MYTIKTLNAISPVGLAKLNNKQFDVAVDTDTPDGILVRSADMLNTAFNDNLLAIARAGAGVNNIPLDRCSEQGIVVFNTPGANANAVAELVIGMLIAGSRNVAAAAQWCQGLVGDPAMAKTVEKGKKQFVGTRSRARRWVSSVWVPSAPAWPTAPLSWAWRSTATTPTSPLMPHGT